MGKLGRFAVLGLLAALAPACGGGGGPAPAVLGFDATGRLTLALGPGLDVIRAVALQADGKIVAAGVSSNGANKDFAVVRFNADGSLDTTFGGDGSVTTPISAAADDDARGVAIQADGKIVVAGHAFLSGFRQVAVVRYNSDGTLDIAFDTDGIVTTNVGPQGDFGEAVRVQADGKIVVAGGLYNGTDEDILVVRYNADGSLDTSFDTDGIVTTVIGIDDEFANDLAIQADGKIVIAGYTVTAGNYDFACVRYNANGSLDASFDTDGIAVTAVNAGGETGEAVAIQADGKIVVAGGSTAGATVDFAAVRYNTDGSLDNSFDTNGRVSTPVGAGYDYPWAMAIQADGKIVLAGVADNGGQDDIGIVRFNTDGSLDLTFDVDGKLMVDFTGGDDQMWGVLILASGKILAAGEASVSGSADFALWRQP